MTALQEASKNEVESFGDILENFVVAVFKEQAIKHGVVTADIDIAKKNVAKTKKDLIVLLTSSGEQEGKVIS